MTEQSTTMPAIEVTLGTARLTVTNIAPASLPETVKAIAWAMFAVSGQLPPSIDDTNEEASLRNQLMGWRQQQNTLLNQLAIFPLGTQPHEKLMQLAHAQTQIHEIEGRLDSLRPDSPPI